jgi:hypothetical protein
VSDGMRCVGLDAARVLRAVVLDAEGEGLARSAMSIVMGLNQHRAQVTAEWLDTETGEVSRGRIVPADRSGVRKFLARFEGSELEVALEATTGWRFLVEELRRVGASVHLAEPAETSALRGSKQRAKNDRADSRHLRELLMAGRLPECWIAPDHLLHLRARVRLRHTLVDERGEWQQRSAQRAGHRPVPADSLPTTLAVEILAPASSPKQAYGRYVGPRRMRSFCYERRRVGGLTDPEVRRRRLGRDGCGSRERAPAGLLTAGRSVISGGAPARCGRLFPSGRLIPAGAAVPSMSLVPVTIQSKAHARLRFRPPIVNPARRSRLRVSTARRKG